MFDDNDNTLSSAEEFARGKRESERDAAMRSLTERFRVRDASAVESSSPSTPTSDPADAARATAEAAAPPPVNPDGGGAPSILPDGEPLRVAPGQTLEVGRRPQEDNADEDEVADRELFNTVDTVKQTFKNLTLAALETASFGAEVGSAIGVPGASAAEEILADQKNLVEDFIGEAESASGAVAGVVARIGGGLAIGGAAVKGTQFALRGVEHAQRLGRAMSAISGSAPTAVRRIGTAAAAGTVSTSIALDPHEDRISNLITGTRFETPVSEWLAANEDDSALDGRLKNIAEGGAAGAVLGAGFQVVKALAKSERLRRVFLAADNSPVPVPENVLEAMDQAALARAGIKDASARIKASKKTDSPDRLKALKAELKGLRDDASFRINALRKTDEFKALPKRTRVRILAAANGGQPFLRQSSKAQLDGETARRATNRLVTDIKSAADRSAENLRSTIGGVARNTAGPDTRVFNQEAFAKGLSNGQTVQDAAARALARELNAGRLNLETSDQRIVIGSVIDTLGDVIDKQFSRQGTQSFDDVIDGARSLVGRATQEDIIKIGTALGSKLKDASVTVLALRGIASKFGDDVAEIGTKIARLGDDVPMELEREFITAVRNLNIVAAPMKGIKREAARITAGGRIQVSDLEAAFTNKAGVDLDLLDRAAIGEFGSRAELLRFARKAALSGGGEDVFNKMVRPTRPVRNAIREYYVNSLLSGPVTQAINNLSNTMQLFYDPTEKGLERFFLEMGAGNTVRGATANAGREMVAVYGALLETSVATTKILAQALRTGATSFRSTRDFSVATAAARSRITGGLDTGLRAQFDPRTRARNIFDATRSGQRQLVDTQATEVGARAVGGDITGDNLLGDNASTYLRHAVDYAGTVIRTPTRIMTSVDETFTNLNFAMHATREAHRIGVGKGLRGVELKDFMTRFPMEADENILAEVFKRGQAAARRGVFQEELGEFAQRAMGLIQNDPTGVAPLAIPFFKTPVNLLKRGMKRTPVVTMYEGILGREKVLRRLVMGSPAQRRAVLATPEGAEYMGRFSVSMMLTATAAATFDGSWITGRAPRDHNARQAWEATGRQEYSIRIGNKWISYGRLDPFATSLGLMADLVLHGPTLFSMFGDRTEDEAPGAFEVGAASIIAAHTSMFASKNMLQGAVQLYDALAERGSRDSIGRFASSFAGGFVPNVISQTEGTLDLWGLMNTDTTVKDPSLYNPDGSLDILRTVTQNIANRAGSNEGARKFNVFGPVERAVGAGLDVVSPFPAREARDTEFARMLAASGASPDLRDDIKEFRGFVLDPQDRDRFGELMTSVKINGRTLTEMGEVLATNPAVQALSPNDPGGGGRFRTQADVLNANTQRFRERAFTELMRENEDMRKRFREFQRARTNPDTLQRLVEFNG